MLSRILSCLMMSCVLAAQAAGQYGQERPRRVNPPAERPATPSERSAGGSTLYVVNAEALEVGCNGYVTKPVDPAALLRNVDLLLGRVGE